MQAARAKIRTACTKAPSERIVTGLERSNKGKNKSHIPVLGLYESQIYSYCRKVPICYIAVSDLLTCDSANVF